MVEGIHGQDRHDALDAAGRRLRRRAHYLKAVAKAGTDDADKVAAAMRTIPIEDIFSENARIRDDGRVTRTMYLARVKEAVRFEVSVGLFRNRAHDCAGGDRVAAFGEQVSPRQECHTFRR